MTPRAPQAPCTGKASHGSSRAWEIWVRHGRSLLYYFSHYHLVRCRTGTSITSRSLGRCCHFHLFLLLSVHILLFLPRLAHLLFVVVLRIWHIHRVSGTAVFEPIQTLLLHLQIHSQYLEIAQSAKDDESIHRAP